MTRKLDSLLSKLERIPMDDWPKIAAEILNRLAMGKQGYHDFIALLDEDVVLNLNHFTCVAKNNPAYNHRDDSGDLAKGG